MDVGCYRIPDTPGQTWFAKSEGCECQAPAPTPPTLPPACADKTKPPLGEYVVYESTVDAVCSDAGVGEKVPDSCCTAPGGFNAMNRSFPEMYRDAGDGICPELFPGIHIEIQCNSDNTFTKGDNCTSTCGSSCDELFVMDVGCYRIPDTPGQTWFAKSEGCECQAPAPTPPTLPPACADKTKPPLGEYVVYESTVDVVCSDAGVGEKVPDSCCTAPGGFNAMNRSFPEMYQDAGDGICPELFPGIHIEIQCNSDNTFTKGDNCTSTCGSSCDALFVMDVGCYRIPDTPGQTWFAKSGGCECQAPAPSPPTL